MLKLLDVRQPTGAVVFEDELVALHHVPAGGGFRIGEAVADDLEDDVERGQCEDTHHHAPVAGGDLQRIGGPVDVPHQIAVELGLAVLVVADRDVELGDRLARHERLEEHDQIARAMDLDMEIRSGEAEDDAHLVGRQQDRIDDDAAGLVVQRQGQWHDLIAAPDPAHQVSALVAVEDGRNHVDGID